MFAKQQIAKQSEEYARGLLAERLELCTEKQKAFFNDRIFPKGVPTEDLASAIDLCNRTIQKLEGTAA